MLFQSGASYYICTGGLVADNVTTSVIPYFLTARPFPCARAEGHSLSEEDRSLSEADRSSSEEDRAAVEDRGAAVDLGAAEDRCAVEDHTAASGRCAEGDPAYAFLALRAAVPGPAVDRFAA